MVSHKKDMDKTVVRNVLQKGKSITLENASYTRDCNL
jgi:hypothetical protein